MTSKIVYLFDESGQFIGPYEAQQSPEEAHEDKFITPELCTDVEPPSFGEDQTCHFIDGQWVLNDIPAAPVVPPSPEELLLMEARQKSLELNSITVTTASGKTLDGNETARGDMVSAITIAGFTGQTSTEWKLADNSVANVTLDELKEALALALAEKGRIVGAIS